jgi:membrane associated rhomboid family serine protease
MTDFRPQRFNILPVVVKNILILNGLMFLASIVCALKFNVDLVQYLGLFFPASEYFQPYQFVTHMFMHAYINPATGQIYLLHIFSNMFALWMFGSVLENIWGPKRFFIFYFSCGLGGALMHLGVTGWQVYRIQAAVADYQSHPGIAEFATLSAKYDHLLNMKNIQQFIDTWKAHPDDASFVSQSIAYAQSFPGFLSDIPIVGASGAVFGVLIAFGMSFPNTYLYLYFLVPVKAKYFVIFYALFELFAGFRGAQDDVAHFAHIGGALIGFLIVKFWNKNRRSDFF